MSQILRQLVVGEIQQVSIFYNILLSAFACKNSLKLKQTFMHNIVPNSSVGENM